MGTATTRTWINPAITGEVSDLDEISDLMIAEEEVAFITVREPVVVAYTEEGAREVTRSGKFSSAPSSVASDVVVTDSTRDVLDANNNRYASAPSSTRSSKFSTTRTTTAPGVGDAPSTREALGGDTGEVIEAPPPPPPPVPGAAGEESRREISLEIGAPSAVPEESEVQEGPDFMVLNESEKPFVLSVMSRIRTNRVPRSLVLVIRKLISSRFRAIKYIIFRKSVFYDTEYVQIKEYNPSSAPLRPSDVDASVLSRLTNAGISPASVFTIMDTDIEPNNIYAYKIKVQYDTNLSAAEEEDRERREYIDTLTDGGRSIETSGESEVRTEATRIIPVGGEMDISGLLGGSSGGSSSSDSEGDDDDFDLGGGLDPFGS